MKSFEALVEIARGHGDTPSMSTDSQDFQDFIYHSGEIEKSAIDMYVFLDSRTDGQKEKINKFLGEYGGHEGKHLDDLFEKFELTETDRKQIMPILKSLDRHNELSHALMDLDQDLVLKHESEMIKIFAEYLKYHKKNLSRDTYKLLKKVKWHRVTDLIKCKIEIKLFDCYHKDNQ